MRAFAYTLVTTAIVLVFALAEWMAERFVSELSRAASVAIEIGIVLLAALIFRPIHKRVESALEAAFYARKRQALAALRKFRLELSSFSDVGQLLRRVVEAVDHDLEARACAVYIRGERYRAERSSFDVAAEDLEATDPLVVRLHSSGLPARPRLLKSAAPGTHAYPMTVAGELIGFLCVDCRHGDYDADETHMLAGLAGDLGVALVALDPRLQSRKRATPNNIPSDLPELIGRERELVEIAAAVARSRLVTITGSGGVGKTLVALQFASGAVERQERAAWFVNLAPITDGALIASTMLTALGSSSTDSGDDLTRLLEYLRPRDAMIVIDNCEHLVLDVAPVVAQIRSTCPRVSLLTTSREILHLDGEYVYRLGMLEPKAAAELFCRRAIAVSPEFEPQMHADAVSGICRHLDGVPLAIELAASRARTLSAEETLALLGERFRLLTSSARGVDPRQQTLAATIEWSYGLLTSEEQSLLRRLSVFRGSFSLQAAAAVCTQGGACDEFHILDLLTSLADKSLLGAAVALATRYRLLETIRAFAAAKAAEKNESALAAGQHAAHFAAVAAQAYHEFDSRMPGGWLERLAPDIDNFRAALEWTLDGPGDRPTGAQLAGNCGPIFLRLGLLAEGLRWCEAARAAAPLVPATAARIEYVASMMHNNALGQDWLALECAERAVALYRESTDERALIRALSQVAQQYAKAHRFDDAKAPAEEAIRQARDLGEPRVLVAVLRRCAFSLPPSEIDRGRELFKEALRAARSTHENDEICRVLEWWAYRESDAGSYERAMELSTEALACADDGSRMYLEGDIAGYALAAGRIHEAEPHARQALALALTAQHPLLLARAIAYTSPFHAADDAETGALLFGYARRQLLALGWEGEADDQLALQTASRFIEGQLDAGAFEALLERGALLREEDALAMIAPASTRSRAAKPVAT